jgi:hypothetical protein
MPAPVYPRGLLLFTCHLLTPYAIHAHSFRLEFAFNVPTVFNLDEAQYQPMSVGLLSAS